MLIGMCCFAGCWRAIGWTFSSCKAQEQACFITKITSNNLEGRWSIHRLSNDFILPNFFQSENEPGRNTVRRLSGWIGSYEKVVPGLCARLVSKRLPHDYKCRTGCRILCNHVVISHQHPCCSEICRDIDTV